MIFGEGGNFLAYGFAPASLIAPLGTVSLISNAIIAPFLLGEVFRIRDAIGILFSILGAVIVVAVNGNSESDEVSIVYSN
jgi:drug/metabolite transporter (DMT)-like permease